MYQTMHHGRPSCHNPCCKSLTPFFMISWLFEVIWIIWFHSTGIKFGGFIIVFSGYPPPKRCSEPEVSKEEGSLLGRPGWVSHFLLSHWDYALFLSSWESTSARSSSDSSRYWNFRVYYRCKKLQYKYIQNEYWTSIYLSCIFVLNVVWVEILFPGCFR